MLSQDIIDVYNLSTSNLEVSLTNCSNTSNINIVISSLNVITWASADILSYYSANNYQLTCNLTVKDLLTANYKNSITTK